MTVTEGFDERQLIQRAICGDADALTTLLEHVGPVVRKGVEGRIPAQWRSLLSEDDVMQQTYADAFRSIAKFVPLGDGAFRAWLAGMANYNLRDAIRMLEADKRGGGRRNVDAVISEESYVALLDLLSSSGTSPTGGVARTEVVDHMRRAIGELPDVYGRVVRMVDLEGYPPREVAGIIGRSLGAVHMLRKRAHDQLRELLGTASKFFADSA